MNAKTVIISALTRRYPFWSGCATIANHRLFRRFVNDRNVMLDAPIFGGCARVPMNDFVGRTVFFFGDLDPKVTWILKRLIKPGDHVADVGANLGILTIAMARLVGPSGQVFAFEPNPELASLLHHNFEINLYRNVTLHSVALGDLKGELSLSVPDGNLGQASLVRKNAVNCRQTVVPIMRLDDLVSQRISFIKIDVEGFELNVLRGGIKTIERDRPIIILECNGHSGCDPIEALLKPLGYDFLGIPRAILRMRTELIKSTPHDLIAVPNERMAEVSFTLRAS